MNASLAILARRATSSATDLNDIEHEPTDARLDALMKSVAEEVARRAKIANEAFMQNLRAAIAAVNKSATDA